MCRVFLNVHEPLQNLLANNRQVWLRETLWFQFLHDVGKRTRIHVLQNNRYGPIVIKRIVAHYNIWALRCVVGFQLLQDLLTCCFFPVHRDHCGCLSLRHNPDPFFVEHDIVILERITRSPRSKLSVITSVACKSWSRLQPRVV